MVGAGVPRGGEVVLSTARLTELGPVDRASAQVTAGAGVTLARVQESARAAGLDAGVDFAARDSATVGGLAATNAGGIRAMRYGTVRARVAGLQAVLADGSIIERPPCSRTTPATTSRPCSSAARGRSAIITAVRWRLVPRLTSRVAAMIGLRSLDQAADLLADVRPRLPSLDAAEFLSDEGLQLVLDHLGLPAPVPVRVAGVRAARVRGPGRPDR